MTTQINTKITRTTGFMLDELKRTKGYTQRLAVEIGIRTLYLTEVKPPLNLVDQLRAELETGNDDD